MSVPSARNHLVIVPKSEPIYNKRKDEQTEDGDNYDYIQDPLTGEIQCIPKILAEYESDEQKQRRKRRNLFAELSGEERERFKEIFREDAESEDECSSKAVERAWNQVGERV